MAFPEQQMRTLIHCADSIVCISKIKTSQPEQQEALQHITDIFMEICGIYTQTNNAYNLLGQPLLTNQEQDLRQKLLVYLTEDYNGNIDRLLQFASEISR